ncbi:hypothetical protein F4777DRAFT_578540 [Nemania sp. FL0916]|nr:hypothetical protein F4777DRAFT_578540 [Nemania sp. FL0916]
MECLVQALLILSLLSPAICAPGPMLGIHDQHSTLKTLVPSGEIEVTPMDPHSPMTAYSPRSAAEAEAQPLELRKIQPSRPIEHRCTSGDRACHASLEYIIFCNGNQDWVKYAECQQGTFCHRLHMVCVPEVTGPAMATAPTPSPTPTRTPAPSPSEPDGDSDGDSDSDDAYASLARRLRGAAARDFSYQCKEGDRKCDMAFNRVDRCNERHDWVTYHDCRKSELCDEEVLDCLPRISFGGKSPAARTPAPYMPNDTVTTLE